MEIQLNKDLNKFQDNFRTISVWVLTSDKLCVPVSV